VTPTSLLSAVAPRTGKTHQNMSSINMFLKKKKIATKWYNKPCI